jgi:hypothetical protein
MKSAFLSGGFSVSVERFLGSLSLSCLPVPAGWIEGREESGHSAGGLDLGAKRAGNAGKQIFDLLFLGRNALISNVCNGLLDTIAGGEVLDLGAAGGFQTGGEGVAACARRRSLQYISAVKIFQHCHRTVVGSKNKKGGARYV